MDAERLINKIQSNSKTYAGKPTVRDTRVAGEAVDAVDADKIRLVSELFDALCHSKQTDRQQKWVAAAKSRLAEYDSRNMVAEDWRSLHQRLSYLPREE